MRTRGSSSWSIRSYTSRKYTAIVETLLGASANTGLQEKGQGLTALMLAVYCGHGATVKALLGAGANTGVELKSGGTAESLAKDPTIKAMFQ